MTQTNSVESLCQSIPWCKETALLAKLTRQDTCYIHPQLNLVVLNSDLSNSQLCGTDCLALANPSILPEL